MIYFAPLHRVVLCLALIMTPAIAMGQASRELMSLFNDLALRGDTVLETEGNRAAIEYYERALLDPMYENFGRIHLRMAQIHQDAKRYAEAAYHFQKCTCDDRVDDIDRKVICTGGFEEVTAPLRIRRLPSNARIFITSPEEYSGPFSRSCSSNRSRGEQRSSERPPPSQNDDPLCLSSDTFPCNLPKGIIELTVEADGHRPRPSKVELDGPRNWEARLGLRFRDGPVVPDGFVSGGIDDPVDSNNPSSTNTGSSSLWPVVLTGTLGAGLVGTGLAIGFDNRSQLENTRATQGAGQCAPAGDTFPCGQSIADASNRALIADTLWISGTTVLTSALIWWLFMDDEPPPEGAP